MKTEGFSCECDKFKCLICDYPNHERYKKSSIVFTKIKDELIRLGVFGFEYTSLIGQYCFLSLPQAKGAID